MAGMQQRRPGATAGQRPGPSGGEQRLQRFFRTPKGTLLLLLGAIAVLAVLTTRGHALGHVLWTVAAATGADLLVSRVRGRPLAFPSGAVLTGCILALVLAPMVPAYVAMLLAVIAIGGKHFLRTRWSNIFNPAALALVVGSWLIPNTQSWWGALPNLGVVGFALVFAAGWYIAHKIHKLHLVLAFLATAVGVLTLASFWGAADHVVQIYHAPDTEMLVFCAFFMLTDPPTSPARPADQLVFGMLAGGAASVLFLCLGVQWFLPGGLLVGNAYESGRRVWAQHRTARTHPKAARRPLAPTGS